MTSGLLAYMSVNAGRLPLARAYCEEALTLARAIDATDLVAWTRGTQSLEAYYAGRYLDARDFALAGIDAAPTSPQAVRLLANGAARALAKLGDRHAAEQALDRARAISDRHELPGDLTSCISFGAYGLARTLADAATVHQILSDTPAVLRYATEVDQHVEAADSDWSRALVTLDVATALLNQPSPEIEQAMQLGRRALTSSGSHPIRSVVQRAGELCTRASQLWPDGAPVHEYEDALSQWRTEPASDILLDPAPAS